MHLIRGGIHIHITKENFFLTFSLKPPIHLLKCQTLNTKFIRNTNLLVIKDTLKIFRFLILKDTTYLHTIILIVNHLLLNIIIQRQSPIKLETQQGTYCNGIKKKTSFKQVKTTRILVLIT